MADNLPEPKSRKESYLAKAAGMDVTIPEQPESREEQYLNAIAEGGGGGGGTSNFNELSNRPKYDNAEMTGSTSIPKVVNTAFTGTDGTAAGTAGLVPAPATTDAGKFLKADGTWDTAGGGGPTVVQTTGTSTTNVMSQDAVTKMVFEGGVTQKPRIGWASAVNANLSCALGPLATVTGDAPYSVAIGAAAVTTRRGEVNIGSDTYEYGYNNSHYRLIGGVYDGQDAHDAATVGQVNSRLGGLTLLPITQAAYDALTTKDANTLYVITGA